MIFFELMQNFYLFNYAYSCVSYDSSCFVSCSETDGFIIHYNLVYSYTGVSARPGPILLT